MLTLSSNVVAFLLTAQPTKARASPHRRFVADDEVDEFEVTVPPGPMGMLLEPRDDAGTDPHESWMSGEDLVVSPCVGWKRNPLSELIPCGSTLVAVDGTSVRGLSLEEVGGKLKAAADRMRVIGFASPSQSQAHGAAAASQFLAMKRQTSREFPSPSHSEAEAEGVSVKEQPKKRSLFFSRKKSAGKT